MATVRELPVLLRQIRGSARLTVDAIERGGPDGFGEAFKHLDWIQNAVNETLPNLESEPEPEHADSCASLDCAYDPRPCTCGAE